MQTGLSGHLNTCTKAYTQTCRGISPIHLIKFHSGEKNQTYYNDFLIST